MKLKTSDKEEYLYKVYSAWYGKVIGVRLGSPVENWSHEQIMAAYPDQEGYLVDYDVYAADDDLNGPLFFVRALIDSEEISAAAIGDAFLNYLCEYSGFFWWGGVGVSSEHTAYENLKNGIPAPLSGSMSVNGKALSEQIGGQIFSDCWGYVSGYDPKLAGKLAAMASSVTHDGCGIQGGIFVAVAICLAMQKNDIHEVIREALTYLDPDQEYYQVAGDIIRFYEENRDDWTECLAYIREHYGYDRYPGVCHIIPNMALMIMAMCYGDNDFDRTLVMLNRSGWDTDCNCGNVGSILGALLGIDRIRESWIRPINDLVNASSAIGCLNIQSISAAAKRFTKLAYELQGMKIEDFPLFHLPYETMGIRCRDGSIHSEKDSLIVQSRDIYKYVYYRPEDLYDARYDPQFSPILEPGDELEIEVETTEEQKLILYVADCQGREWQESCPVKEKKTITWKIPSAINLVINRIGLRSQADYRILDLRIHRTPKLHYRFADLPIDRYGPRYEGDRMNNIRAFVRHSGSWSIEKGLKGESGEHALISTGNYGNVYRQIRWRFTPETGSEHLLLFSMKGYLDYAGIGLKGQQLVCLQKKKEVNILKAYPCEWKPGEEMTLKLQQSQAGIQAQLNGESFLFPDLQMKDLIGIRLGENGCSISHELTAD